MSMSREDRAIVHAAARIKRESKAARTRARKAVITELGVFRGRVLDSAYLAWLRRRPCVVGGDCDGAVQAAHLRYSDAAVGRINPGLQVKPSDKWATPLCARHHAEQHAHGNERAWWAGRGLNGSEVAAQQFALFQSGAE